MPCNSPRAHNLAELRDLTRRQFFETCGVGVGKIALASLLTSGSGAFAGEFAKTQATSAPAPLPRPMAPRSTHFPAKAKRVIYLFMVGAPSQLDLFDHKPTLIKHDGQPIPQELTK